MIDPRPILGVDSGMMALIAMPADMSHPAWRENPKGYIILPYKTGEPLTLVSAYIYQGYVNMIEFGPGAIGSFTLGADQVLVLSDPCYVLAKGPYTTCCEALWNQGHYTKFEFDGGAGVVATSGYGDGKYEAEVDLDDEGWISAVYFEFIPELNEEDIS